MTAAAELFVERGYAAATIAAIAGRAGVARPTVFPSVPGGKPELLKLARDLAIAGDDEPVPVPERGWFRSAMAQDDPAELLARQAGFREVEIRFLNAPGHADDVDERIREILFAPLDYAIVART